MIILKTKIDTLGIKVTPPKEKQGQTLILRLSKCIYLIYQ